MNAGTTVALALVCAIASGCVPSTAPGAPANPTGQVGAPGAPKVLRIVASRKFSTFAQFTGVATSSSTETEVRNIVHDFLVVADENGVYQPQLAVEVPSLEKGTWRLNPDGTMDTTWRIRPNVTWQDGQPFTADDLLFTYTAYKAPALPSYYGAALDLMTGAEVVDPQTFVVHWSKPYFQADLAPGLDPLPRPTLDTLYKTNKDGFDTSPFFRQEFVGTGPYRIKTWVEG